MGQLFSPGNLLDPLNNPVQPDEDKERRINGGLFTPQTLTSTVPAPQPRDLTDDLHVAVRNAGSAPPAQAARALSISSSTGLEPGVVLRNQKTLEPEQEHQRLKDLAFGRPALTKFFTDPINVDLARDEADRLAHIEDVFRGNRPSQFQEMAAVLSGADNSQLFRLRADALTRGMDPQRADQEAVLRMSAYRNPDTQPEPEKPGFFENLKRAYNSGDMMVDRGELYSQKMVNVLTGTEDPALDKQIATFEQQEASAPQYEEGWFASAAQLLPYMARSLVHGQKRGAEYAMGFGSGAAAITAAGPQVVAEPITVPAAAATGYAAGTAVGSTEFVAKVEAGNAFADIRKITDERGRPIDDRVAAVAAMGVGAVNAALERLGLSTVAKTIPGGQQLVGRFTTEATKAALKSPAVRKSLMGAFAHYGEALITEPTTEMLQEVSGIIGEEVAKMASGESYKGSLGMDKWADPDTVQRIVDTGVAAFQGTAVLGAPGTAYHVATRTKKAAQLSKQAQENKDFFTAVNQAVEGSKLRELVPDRFKAYAQQIEDLPETPKEVYVPAEALRQAVGDDVQLKTFLESAGISDQFGAALAEKGDVRIPMSEFLTRVAGTEAALKLENDFRFNERQMTPREAAEWSKNYQALWGEDVKRAQEAAARVAAENDGAAQVQDVLRNGLSAIGLKPEEAEAQSAIWAARAQVASEGYTKAGQTMTPLDWLRSKNLTVRNEKTGTSFSVNGMLGHQDAQQGQEQVLNQSAFHGSPYRFDKFSLEHLGSGEGAQAYGHGLYFAGNKEVAEWYRTALAGEEKAYFLDGKQIDFNSLDAQRQLALRVISQPETYGNALTKLEAQGAKPAVLKKIAKYVEEYKGRAEYKETPKGQLYKVNIPEDDHLMLWDEPLSKQPEAVKKALEKGGVETTYTPGWNETHGGIYRGHLTILPERDGSGKFRVYPSGVPGLFDTIEEAKRAADEKFPIPAPYEMKMQDVYYRLTNKLGSDRAASEYLRSLGISGHKYLDGSSRSAGEGGHNYVIYDDQAVQIARTFYQSAPEDRTWAKWEPERTSAGKIKGAPEWVASDKDLQTMRRSLHKFVQEGLVGRMWYENSAEAVVRMVGGDLENAEKFIQLLAIYSPNSNVWVNTIQAVKAYTHWAAGGSREDFKVGSGAGDAKAIKALYDDEPWAGRKTNSFYMNLMHDIVQKYPEEVKKLNIDPEVLNSADKPATIDVWMARAFGYAVEQFADDKGTGQYSFSENEVRRLTARLNMALAPDEPRWTPHQVQAAIWTAVKSRYEVKEVKEKTNRKSLREGLIKIENGVPVYPHNAEDRRKHLANWRHFAMQLPSADVIDSAAENARSFGDDLQRMTDVVTWEAIPSPSFNADLLKASPGIQRAFTAEARALLMDEQGNDLLSYQLGVPVSYSAEGFGGYASAISPNNLSHLLPARKAGQDGFSVDEVRSYARAIQYIFKQDAVPWFRPENKPLTSAAAVEEQKFRVVNKETGRVFKNGKFATQAEAEAFAKTKGENAEVRGGTLARSIVLRYSKALDPDALQANLDALKGFLGEDAGFTRTADNEITVVNFRDDETKLPFARSDEEFISKVEEFANEHQTALGITDLSKAWVEGEYGYVHDWKADPEGEALREGASGGRPVLHSWLRGRRNAFDKLLEQYSGDNLARLEQEGRTFFQSGSAGDRVRAGSLEVAARYGQPREGSTSVLGVHYSSQPRVSLSGQFYGTGLKGEEFKRLASAPDDRIKQRIHFYVDTGAGIAPEPGVGSAVHAVHLDNVYDVGADPLGLKAKVDSPSLSSAEFMNALESAVLDAGYDGVYMPKGMGDMGVAVLLGPANTDVKVQQIQPGEGMGPAAEQQRAPEVSPRVMDEGDGAQKILYTDMDSGRVVGSVILRDGVASDFQMRDGWAGKGFEEVIQRDVEARGAQSFNQATRPSGDKANVTFRQNQIILRLFKTADQSSFAHESAHIFLDDLRQLAQLPNAPQEVKDDWAAVKKYVGATSDVIARDQHETFARSFEAYLREGRAPSTELQGVFQRFKGWLTRIYRSVLSLNVEVNDEIRGVFDRMLATEDMIQQAQDAEGIRPQFATAEEAGMDPAGFAAYQKAFTDGKERAKEMLLAKAMKQIEGRNKAWYIAERERAWTEERDAVLADPAYRALYTISKGAFPDAVEGEKVNLRLNSEAIRSEYGEEALQGLTKTVPPLTSKTGLHPDVVAEHLGFSSGQALVQALQNLRSLRDVVAERVESRMNEYQKLMADRDMRAEAEAMVQNEMRLEFLALEEQVVQNKLDVLGRREERKRQTALNNEFKTEDFKDIAAKGFRAQMVREAAARAAMIRRAADEAISGMKVTVATQMGRHVQAERKAANEAIAAAKKGDNAALAEAKRRQMIAAALASRARDAKEEVDSALSYLKKFDSPGVRKNLARDYLDQIDQLLERFDLRKSVTGTEIEARKSLTKWVEEQRAKGYEPVISEKLEAEARRISYKDMSLGDFRDLRDAVKSIEHIARLKQKLLTARNQRTFESAVHEMVDTTYQAFGEKMGPDRIPRDLAKKKPLLKQIDADLTKVEFMCMVLDGGKMNGPWWEMIYRPVNDGFNKKAARFMEIHDRLYGKDMFGAYTEKELVRMRSKKFFVQEVGESFTKEQLLAVALNRGNAYNWSALLEGEGWAPQQGEAVLKLLDDRDWAVVQKIWTYLDTFRPEIGALYKRLAGVEPSWVQGDEFTTPTGKTLAGGYYPLKADRDLEIRASQREEAKTVQEMFGGNGFRPSTRNGHIIERKGFGGQRVSFSLDVLVRHLDEVTHDLYLREAVIDVDRMLQEERIQHTVVRSLGREQYDQLRPWLASVAGQKAYDYDGIQRVVKMLRKNATMAIMGVKSTVFLSQYAGLMNSIPLITNGAGMGIMETKGALLKNLMSVIAGGASFSKVGKFVEERSIELKDRRHNFERDVADMSHNFGFGKYVSKWQEAMMYFTGLADYHVSVASWKTAFDAKLKAGSTEQQAIDFADSVVRMGQGSGKEKDLSRIQRGDEWKRMWTMFYSYMNVNYNQLASAGKTFNTGKRLGRFLGEVAYYGLFPCLAAELLSARGPDDDKDESWLGWAAKTLAMYPAGFFPGIRDIVRMAEDDYGRPVSLLGRVGASVRGLVQEYNDDDGDNAALFWKALETAGYFVPFPVGQARITLKQFWEYMNNERDDLSLFYYKKK